MGRKKKKKNGNISKDEALKLVQEQLYTIEAVDGLCHGTSSEFAEFIQEEGLKPRKCTEEDVCRTSLWHGSWESLPDRVYIGAERPEGGEEGERGYCSSAAGYARSSVGGEPVMFCIELGPEDEKFLVLDEDAATSESLDEERKGKGKLQADPYKLGNRCFVPLYIYRDLLTGGMEYGKVFGRKSLNLNTNHRVDMYLTPEARKKLATWLKTGPSDEDISKFCIEMPDFLQSIAIRGNFGYMGTVPAEKLNVCSVEKGEMSKERREALGLPERQVGWYKPDYGFIDESGAIEFEEAIKVAEQLGVDVEKIKGYSGEDWKDNVRHKVRQKKADIFEELMKKQARNGNTKRKTKKKKAGKKKGKKKAKREKKGKKKARKKSKRKGRK